MVQACFLTQTCCLRSWAVSVASIAAFLQIIVSVQVRSTSIDCSKGFAVTHHDITARARISRVQQEAHLRCPAETPVLCADLCQPYL